MNRMYASLERMIETALLQTSVARSIVRKASVPQGQDSQAVDTSQVMDLSGQYSKVQSDANSQYGSLVDYSAGSDYTFLPDNTDNMFRYGDFEGVGQARVVATVTKAGLSGSTLEVVPYTYDLGLYNEVLFVEGVLVCPLDEEGLHVTAWHTFEWPLFDTVEKPVEIDFFIHNPSLQAGTVGLGLCQLQIR